MWQELNSSDGNWNLVTRIVSTWHKCISCERIFFKVCSRLFFAEVPTMISYEVLRFPVNLLPGWSWLSHPDYITNSEANVNELEIKISISSKVQIYQAEKLSLLYLNLLLILFCHDKRRMFVSLSFFCILYSFPCDYTWHQISANWTY